MIDSVVIAGAGQAGAWVARTLRSEGYAGRIVMCGAEAEPPYERPPLSKEQLVPGAPGMTYLIGAEEFPELSVDWRAATSIEKIDRASRRVALSSGRWLDYGALVIATGGRAHLPPIPGFDLGCVFTLRSLGDARRLRSRLLPGSRVLVVGGGWIGLEVAATAVQAGAVVTLAEMGPSLCARSGSPALSSYLYELHASKGVNLRLNTRVVQLLGNGQDGCIAEFHDGSKHEADVVVLGAGMRPNSEIALEADLDCDGGVVVDAAGRTSDPAIYAAGDVAVLRTSDGRKLRLESWQNAQDQGIGVAQSLLGKPVQYDPVPFFWSSQYDALIQMAGNPRDATQSLVRGVGRQRTHIGLDSSGRVVFGMCINAPRDIRMVRRSISDTSSDRWQPMDGFVADGSLTS